MIVMSVVELSELIEAGVKNALRAMGWPSPPGQQDNASMDVDETCRFLKMAKGTLYKLTSQRKIPHRKVGRKLLFDRNELVAWRDQYKRSTAIEIDMAASNYFITQKAA